MLYEGKHITGGGAITEIRINLGSGSRGLQGWINVDLGTKYVVHRYLPLFKVMQRAGLVSSEIVDWIRDTGVPPPNLKRWDLRSRLPVRDGSVSAVYCSELLEHLREFEARELLTEVRRVLVPGGVIRISVPDLAKICQAYVERRIDANRLASFFYIPTARRPHFVERLGRALYATRYHEWMYDLATLNDLLSTAGFSHVSVRDPRRGELPDVELLEANLDDGRMFSMYVEAKSS